MLQLAKKELKLQEKAAECQTCRKKFVKKFANDKNYRKVRHHCHYTGKYRGAAHIISNLKFKVSY